MPFELSTVDLDRDWDELFACEWAAWMNPRQSMWELTFPNLSSGFSAEAEAIKSAAARQLQDTKTDPSSQWIKMTDAATGKIVAGALWKFHDSNPYRAPLAKPDATWLPEGELRDLYHSWYAQNRVWARRVMPVAHAHLIILFTHPAYRNRGIGGRLVEWGTREADKRGYEAYVEGTRLGRKVYERYGFVVMHISEMHFENASPGEEWKRLVKEMLENPVVIMWRPVSGKYVKGETVVPWEGEPRKE